MPRARRKGATQGKNKLENGNEGTRIREDERESSPLAGDTAVPGGHAKERVTHSQGPDGKQARVQDTGGRAGLGGIAAGWRRTPGPTLKTRCRWPPRDAVAGPRVHD